MQTAWGHNKLEQNNCLNSMDSLQTNSDYLCEQQQHDKLKYTICVNSMGSLQTNTDYILFVWTAWIHDELKCTICVNSMDSRQTKTGYSLTLCQR